MNWLHYLAEANLYLTVFYLAYRLLLAKETYNQLNRIYLLFSCVAAFALPVLQMGVLKPVETATIAPSYSTELVYPMETTTTHVINASPTIVEHHLTWHDYLIYIYAAGCTLLLLALLVKLFVLARMIRDAKREQQDKYKLIYLPQSDVAFSFFNYLFIGTDAMGAKTIIRHELVHIRQRHSLDILFVELLKIINWFNPFIYLLQNSLKTIHEYIADEQTAAHESDTVAYATFLVNNAYGAGGSSITHSFFNYNLLKKRIIMLNQKRSGSSARLKYLITAPICAGLLCVSTLAFSKDYGWVDLDPAKAESVVANTLYAPAVSPAHANEKLPPPPPMLTANGYSALSYHLYKNINYHPSKADKGGVVLINFSVTRDHKVIDTKISKSAGKTLDALALNAFNTYKLPVNDKAGKNYIARFYFYTTDYSIFNDKFKDKLFRANYKLDVLLTNQPHIYRKTGKGYEYQLYDGYSEDVKNGKPAYFVNKVVIFEKNGAAKTFTPKSDLRILRGKYGFDWPKEMHQIKFPPPIITPTKSIEHQDKHDGKVIAAQLANVPIVQKADGTNPLPTIFIDGKLYQFSAQQIALINTGANIIVRADKTTTYPANDPYALSKWGDLAKNRIMLLNGHVSVEIGGKIAEPLETPAYIKPDSSTFQAFLKDLGDHIKYPAITRESNTTGRVIAIFSVDDNGNLQYLKIVRSVSNSLSEEVFRVIKQSPIIKKMPGKWAIPVFFTLGYEDGSSSAISISLPASETEPKTFEYNPNNIPSPNGLKMLNEVVIRGYIKLKKN